jgi:hypothetical protein
MAVEGRGAKRPPTEARGRTASAKVVGESSPMATSLLGTLNDLNGQLERLGDVDRG